MFNFRIHHISINVSDINKSKEFYSLLEFVEGHSYTSETGDLKITHLLSRNCILELFWYSKKINYSIIDKISHHEFIGIDHFSLETDNIENAYVMLKKSIPLSDICLGRTGIKYFFIKDPDGIDVEIVEDKRKLIKEYE